MNEKDYFQANFSVDNIADANIEYMKNENSEVTNEPIFFNEIDYRIKDEICEIMALLNPEHLHLMSIISSWKCELKAKTVLINLMDIKSQIIDEIKKSNS